MTVMSMAIKLDKKILECISNIFMSKSFCGRFSLQRKMESMWKKSAFYFELLRHVKEEQKAAAESSSNLKISLVRKRKSEHSLRLKLQKKTLFAAKTANHFGLKLSSTSVSCTNQDKNNRWPGAKETSLVRTADFVVVAFSVTRQSEAPTQKQ